MVKVLVVSSLHAVRLHYTAVVVAEVAIIDCGVVCVQRALQGPLLLVGRVLGAVGPRVLRQFVWEGVDRAQHLAITPGLFIAKLFRLIVATVILPVAIAGALDTKVLCYLTFFIVGAIAIMFAIDVPALLIVAIVRAALGVA